MPKPVKPASKPQAPQPWSMLSPQAKLDKIKMLREKRARRIADVLRATGAPTRRVGRRSP